MGKAAQWKDTTSYSQTETPPRIPREWTWTGHTMRVVLSRRLTRRNAWFVYCRELAIDGTEVAPDRANLSAEDAQHCALAMVQERLAEMDYEVLKAMGES